MAHLTLARQTSCSNPLRIGSSFPPPQTLTDLDDYLSPSQACILPVKQTNKVPKAQQEGGGAGGTEIQLDASNNVYEVEIGVTAPTGTNGGGNGSAKPLEKAEISLNDCLACR